MQKYSCLVYISLCVCVRGRARALVRVRGECVRGSGRGGGVSGAGPFLLLRVTSIYVFVIFKLHLMIKVESLFCGWLSFLFPCQNCRK